MQHSLITRLKKLELPFQSGGVEVWDVMSDGFLRSPNGDLFSEAEFYALNHGNKTIIIDNVPDI